ncbi:MAG: hypothetical protein ABSH28_17970 [Acidobacteriota bacterium]|jgi:hypothetical protein
MTPETPAKRRRGGQPGNKNAERNRGGRGAPIGNQYARKPLPSAADELIQDYPAPALSDWIKTNKEKIDAAELPLLNHRDRAFYSVFTGRTPEWSSEKNLELRYELYEYPPVFSAFEARMVASLRHLKGA